MRQVATLQFVDEDSRDDAVVIVQAEGGHVGLTLSLRKDGDVMVVFTLADFESLLAALQEAHLIAKSN